ncbi:hypothetical protein QAD02_021338 [Eretmocerus hayati]|uniref:Uncharacterized protein n=1 Tax=Eretmocerus hayati TaxID=131215 RepID=A0ACC2PUT0_9HYME|nr:hypothetical protein QAD02_021338 [Eretmocerus hayati]
MTIYYRGPIKNKDEIVKRVDLDMVNMSMWADANGHHMNADKIVAIWFANIMQHNKPVYLAQCKPGSECCSKLDLVIKWARTDTYKHSYSVGVCRLWNDLPGEIRYSYSKPVFKVILFNYMVSKALD